MLPIAADCEIATSGWYRRSFSQKREPALRKGNWPTERGADPQEREPAHEPCGHPAPDALSLGQFGGVSLHA
jgi:hypothetical protein